MKVYCIKNQIEVPRGFTDGMWFYYDKDNCNTTLYVSDIPPL
jgi:hypothetical protein